MTPCDQACDSSAVLVRRHGVSADILQIFDIVVGHGNSHVEKTNNCVMAVALILRDGRPPIDKRHPVVDLIAT